MPQQLLIDELQCQKLSEQMAGFGSVNDEIILALFYVNIDGGHDLLWQSSILEIGEEGEKVAIGELILLGGYKQEGHLKLVVLEQDTERSGVEMLSMLGGLLNENKSLDDLKKGMRDDDLLGVQTLSMKNVLESGALRFWGLQLFDEYEYILRYRFR